MKIFILLALFSVINLINGQIFGKCFTPDEYKGDCVYFKSCPSLLEIFTRRPVIATDRIFLSRSQCGFRDGQPLVCCRENFTLASTVPPSFPEPTSTVPTTAPPKTAAPETAAPPTVPPQFHNESLLATYEECGISADDYIYGGNETLIDEYPWMAMLHFLKPQGRTGFHCGGSLINKRYVLTAAHCVNGKDIPTDWTLFGVRLGDWDKTTTEDCDESFVEEKVCSDPTVDISIELKITHENYDPYSRNQHYDIALLRLSREVDYTHYIQPICLQVDKNLRNENFEKQTLSVAGWGLTEMGFWSSRKLKVNVDGMSLNNCQRVYNLENVEISNKQICAGGEFGYDSCRGDSGGPLMRLSSRGNPPHWLLVGVVSYGRTPCGQPGWPAVYTKVGNFIPWIEANLRP